MCPPANLRSLKRVTFAELGLSQKCPRYFGLLPAAFFWPDPRCGLSRLLLLAMTFFIRHAGINLPVLKGS
jgi:hypothetical protein